MPITATSKNRLSVKFARTCAALLLLACSAAGALAQVKSPQRGFNAGGSYAISDIEMISTTGGNLSLRVPVGSLPAGRGGLKMAVNLVYNSKLYDGVPSVQWAGLNRYDVTQLSGTVSGAGWDYGYKYTFEYTIRSAGYDEQGMALDPCTTSPHTVKATLTTPDGSKHPLVLDGHTDGDGYQNVYPDGRPACAGGPSLNTTLSYYTTDGTFLRVDVAHDDYQNSLNNPWTIYQPDGGRVTGGGGSNVPQRIYDRNNNYIEIVETLNDQEYGGHTTIRLKDQVERSVIIELNSAPNQDSVHMRGTSNQPLTTVVRWTNVQVRKSYDGGSSANLNLVHGHRSVQGIDLPSQAGALSYAFEYNADGSNPTFGWGELSAVTLPSGAKAKYSYLYDGQNHLGTDQVLQNRPTQKQLVYRPEYDLTGAVSNAPCTQGCTTETWNYATTYAPGNEIPISSTITGSDGGVTTEHFNRNENGVAAQNGLVYKSERPDGTIVERYWRMNQPHTANTFGPGATNYYAKYEFTSIRDANGNLSKTAVKEFSQDKNGNTTGVKEYDWMSPAQVLRNAQGRPYGVVSSGVQPKRVTTNSYYAATPDAADTSTPDVDTYNQPTAPQFRGAVTTTETGNGTQALARTEYVYDNATTAANVTGQKSWDSQKGAYSNPLTAANSVSVSTQYNSYGSPTLSIDARGMQTEYTYGAVGIYDGLYPTIVKVGFGTTLVQVSTQEYDYYTGAVTRSTDANGVAMATTYDAFGRPTLVKAAEGIATKETRTATDYSDVNRRVVVRSDLTNAGDGKLVSIQHYDQLGRMRLSRQLEDAATQSETDETAGVKVQTRYLYSGANSYQLVSNPYRAAYSHLAGGEPSMGWTRSKSDSGGREVEAQTFNGATLPAPWGANTSSSGTVLTAYDAEFTTVTDQKSRARRSAVNGMGQLARVDEPDKDTGDLGFAHAPVQPTFYSYDALGNLTQVTQGTQTRMFNYSSLSRLVSAMNPESGTVSYTYDPGGNLLTKTDARPVTVTYTYDALSRNNTVDYSNTTLNPDIERHYDNPAAGAYGRGRFWKDYKGGNDTTGSEVEHRAVDAYDALGRPLAQRQKFKTGGVWSADYTTSRTYTRAGSIETQTLPSGHDVNHTYDAAGRLQTFSGNLGDGMMRSYSTGAGYDAAGRVTREEFGTWTPLYHKRHYNTRGQLYDVRLGSAADEWSWNRGAIVAYYDGAYSWSNSGNAATVGDNNGNVTRAQVWVPGDDAVSAYALSDEYFEYDALNRLKSVNEYKEGTNIPRAHAFIQAYDYDRWGNRQIDAGATSDTLNEKQFDGRSLANTNRLYAPGDLDDGKPDSQRLMRYDPAGNLTHDSYTGKGDRAYDAENRMTSSVIGINSSAHYAYDADGKRVRRSTPNGTVWQVYGMDGELLAEYAAGAPASSPQKEYGYRGGELLITAVGSGSGGSGGASAAAAATFVKTDTTTQGTWKGVYGADGYYLAGDGVTHPAYAQVSFSGHSSYTWAATTTDVRGLQKSAPGSADRLAGTWYSATSYTIDLNLTDGGAHQVALYCLDWDGNNARTQRVEVLDAATNAVLGSRNLTAFTGGQYVVWNLRGHVKLKVIYTGPAGFNAAASGLFFDADRVNVAAAARGATATASSVHPNGVYTAASTINGDRRGLNWGAGGGWNDGTPNAYPDWVQVDFAGAQTITEVDVFTCQDNYANPAEPTEAMTFSLYGLTGFEVQYWTGTAWANVPNGSVTGNNRVWRKFTFAPLTTTKIRVLTSAGLATSSRLTEIEAWGLARLPVATATASTTYGTNTPALAVDGDEATSWVASNFPTQWIELDLGQETSVARLRLQVTQTPNGATTHQIAGGMTQGALTPLGTLTGATQTGQWLEATFAETSVRYLRVTTQSSPAWVAWAEIEVYGAGGNGAGGVRWLVTDHLGTPRMVADLSGHLDQIKRHDYLPFGEELFAETGGRKTNQGYSQPNIANPLRERWATYERDDETGLDYAQARYYSSVQGRFTSPDEFTGGPAELSNFVDDAADNPTFYATLTNPQSLNKYQYCINNPLRYIDPDGHQQTGTIPAPVRIPTRIPGVTITISQGKVTINTPFELSPEQKEKVTKQLQEDVRTSGTPLRAMIERSLGIDPDPQIAPVPIPSLSSLAAPLPNSSSMGMLGENGPQITSKPIWKGKEKDRLDIENPNPGQRPGQIHYQDKNNKKYLYDPTTNSFKNAPNKVNKLLKNERFRKAIEKGLRMLNGE